MSIEARFSLQSNENGGLRGLQSFRNETDMKSVTNYPKKGLRFGTLQSLYSCSCNFKRKSPGADMKSVLRALLNLLPVILSNTLTRLSSSTCDSN